jgi:hypothetical protein
MPSIKNVQCLPVLNVMRAGKLKIKNWSGSLLQGEVPGIPGITPKGRYPIIALGKLDPPSLKLWRAGIFNFSWTFLIVTRPIPASIRLCSNYSNEERNKS